MVEVTKSQAGAPKPPPGVRDVFSTVLETVTTGIAAAKMAGTPLLHAVVEIVRNAAKEAEGISGDRVPGAKAIIMGIVRSAGEKGDAGLQILSQAAKILIRHTADLGGDLAAATKGLVLGAIASARLLELDSVRTSSAAAQGALEGAVEAGSVTVDRVQAALKEPIGGIKVVFTKPVEPRIRT